MYFKIRDFPCVYPVLTGKYRVFISILSLVYTKCRWGFSGMLLYEVPKIRLLRETHAVRYFGNRHIRITDIA